MSILSLASGQSACRGYDYFENKKVVRFGQTGENSYTGVVSGSSSARYEVVIDIAHPRKSSCTCPHAAGRRIICKHMVAVYFAAFPEAAERYSAELQAAMEEEEEQQQEYDALLQKYVAKMKKTELQEALLQLLYQGPEWQYDQFIRQYIDW